MGDARIVLVMGPAGSGKTTVGQLLAGALGWPYFEADDFHPPANIAKMRRAEPLDDADRAPWLAAIRGRIDACVAEGRSAVFTCSALKRAYRHVVMDGVPGLRLVYLHADAATLAARLAARRGHFLPPELLTSQLAILEPPDDALAFDVRAHSAESIVAEIRRALGVADGT